MATFSAANIVLLFEIAKETPMFFLLSSASSVCQSLFILHLQRLRQNSINSVRLPCLFGSRTELIVYGGESVNVLFLP